MAYIAPTSDVYILRRVSLDKDYNHTVLQISRENQFNMFNNPLYKKFVLTYQSYQRSGANKIRVGILADELYDCNYMMFRNTAFGNKWFYAFINKITYLNNNASEIEYSIDDMQTWYFDYELGQCFVEREHSLTDVAGDNIVPENLEIGELITRKSDSLEFHYMLGGIITKKPMPQYIGTHGEYKMDQSFVWADGTPAGGYDAPSGVPTGVTVYTGIPISRQDVEGYWSSYSSSYKMQTFASQAPLYVTAPMTLGRVLNIIANNEVREGEEWSMEDVVDVFIYPAELNLNVNITRANNNGYRKGVAFGNMTSMTRPVGFADARNSSSLYFPKNNKLYTFPYIQLELSNNMGKNATYRYEDFIDPTAPKFAYIGNYNAGSVIMCLPLSYRGVGRNFENGLTVTNFPVPAFVGNAYYTWLETNRNNVTMTMISSAVSSLTSIATMVGGVATENPALVATGTVNLVGNIGKTLGKIEDIKNTPPQVQGQVICDAFNTGLNRTGFRFYHMTVKKEIAQIIDGYFTMFGYATNEVKVPNVRLSGANIRPHWNYIKTKGCIIHASRSSGLPSDAESKIASLYDRGITFWKDLEEIGNYGLDNSPV